MDQHCHGSELDVVQPQSPMVHTPIGHHILGLLEQVLVQPALSASSDALVVYQSQVYINNINSTWLGQELGQP